MNAYDIPAGTVVVGVDGSPQSQVALAWAIEQAVAERRPLTLAHASAGVGESGTRYLEDAREVVTRRAPELEVHELLRVADPRLLLMHLGEHAAMLVVGSRGRGPVRSLLLGSVGVALVRHATCPVVVHRPGNPGLVRQGVVVGVDGSERSAPVLEFGYRVAAQRDLPLTVLHSYWDVPESLPELYYVDPPPGGSAEERRALSELVAGLGEKYPEVNARVEAVRGLVRTVLADRSERANLLVLGAHHGGLSTALLLGSVTSDMVEHAECPVAVVPLA